ncbi:MAG: cytochrome b/b6 domain-containing protein [Desulfobacterales bacterium]|nr:cytochrome b/b6 domain-containing protein [Desulfobacterales bacterium]
MDKKLVNVYLYTRYERFWHWFQGVVIILLLTTGFEVHGTFSLFGFQRAVTIHNYAGLTWLISFFFFVFWILTTGEWRQYIPTTKKMFVVVRYYAWGIFKGEPHPVPKRKDAKHNPLQRLTYLSVAAFLLPLQMLTGFLYWGYNHWAAWGLPAMDLSVMAIVHTAVAFAILQFLVIHIYMTTTGHSIFVHIKAMITGWEAVDPEHKIEEWEKKAT